MQGEMWTGEVFYLSYRIFKLVYENIRKIISTVKPTRCVSFFKFILFCSTTLHVSDGLSIHHQESKIVHTASGIRQTDSVDYLLAGTRWNWSSISFPLASSQQNVFDIYLMLYVQS